MVEFSRSELNTTDSKKDCWQNENFVQKAKVLSAETVTKNGGPTLKFSSVDDNIDVRILHVRVLMKATSQCLDLNETNILMRNNVEKSLHMDKTKEGEVGLNTLVLVGSGSRLD
ncbi:hypothetical protein LOAG_00099 [Loa loa]|uniref:Uncharacterized protein n=1 Tax=Loa loa TaxID=7209 RepID=A0A1S0UBZ7_LOALO|nr:hypothetical protein LOAG_00099 [Loa loa]EFO28367.1 hypothetical protein LOAG_00099 [Loa loa]